jgi:hypothetical protein
MTDTETATAKREYKLAAEPCITPVSGQIRREIVEITEDGHRSVILVVSNDDALDVRDALARAYQDGREDRGSEDEPLEPLPVRHHPGSHSEPVTIDARKNYRG